MNSERGRSATILTMNENRTVQPSASRPGGFRTRTITKDLTTCLVLIVVIVSAIAIVFNYFYAANKEEQRLQHIADEYQSYLKESLELPVWNLDRKFSVKIAESYFKNELIESIQVTEKFHDSDVESDNKIIFNKSKSTDPDLIVRESGIYHNGKKIGEVRLGLTRRVYKDTLRQLLISNTLTLAVVVVSLVFLTAVLIRLFVKKPLNSLMQGINQISRGNYGYRFKPFQQAEIQSIISDFRFMADQIQHREKSLAEINHQLALEVNARKKIESLIRNSEAQLRATFEASSNGILVTDNNGRIINANDRFFKMWKMPPEFRESTSVSPLTEFILEQLKKPEAYHSKFYKNGKETFEELQLKDGRIFEKVCCGLIYSGKNFGSVMNFRDVTDLKKSIKALRESEVRFRQLSEAALEAIVIHDNGLILQVNERFLKVFGYARQEVVGKLPFIEIIAPESREIFELDMASRRQTFLDIDGLRRNKESFPLIVQTKEMAYYGKTVFVSVLRDVSDRKAAEAETRTLKEKLAKSKKMEALGLLAGGVAHDLNNILSGVVSYPELLLMKKGLDEKTRKALKVIQDSGQRAAAVVNDLTTISRGIASNKEVLNLNSVIKEYLISPEFAKLDLKAAKIELKSDLAPDLLNIEASRLHIRKSIMNLVQNAAEAIEAEGRITIATTNRNVTQPLKDIQPGTYAVLSISDTGAGISKEEIDRIFEPFYTKKIMGRSGTGLGLTVVWNTVQDHNGYVVVENKQNFTTFDMYFPVTRKMTPVQIKKVSAGDLKGNGERILLVDDDPNQRDITGEMLKALGYHVAAADSGEAAVDKIRKNPFDLVVLDMIMPGGMNGLETYKEVLKIKAAQKAIIASGFSVNDDVKAAQRLGAGQFLKKPFAMEALARAVKNELIRN